MTTSGTPRSGSSPRSVAGTPRSAAAAAAKRLRKQCTAAGCVKVDAGGGFCVAHGGGKKCAFPGCRKGYQTGGFCRQHGGGARCQVDGCGKVDAGRGLCRAHGGGKRCQQSGCTKADVGGGFCTAHGGGKRCAEPGCTKIDQGGGKCRAHGGARRCRHDGCTHPARGATGLCSDHGGAQLCATPNCRRIAKAEGGTFCTSCAASRGVDHKSDFGNDDRDDAATIKLGAIASPSAGDAGRMPPFREMLARTSPRYEYSPLPGADGMEPFHAFVQAATNAGVTSPPQYGDVEMDRTVRTPLFTATPTTDDEAADKHRDDENQEDPGAAAGSCLDNGCSKSFGGRCNCKAGCTCCARAQAAERGDQGSNQLTTATTATKTPRSASSVSFLQLQRVALGVQPNKLPLEIIVSMLKAVRGVRGVHIKAGNDDESQQGEEAAISVVLRCNPEFDVGSLDVLTRVSIQYEVRETSPLDWSWKEIVLRVADMMCPGNCGRTVMNALQPITDIHTANLVFDERCVIARGDMSAQQLCEAVDAVGFEPVVVAELPLAKRFTFRVVDFASVHLMETRLRNLFLEVEGVETVLCTVNRAEALVEATLPDAGSLLQAAHAKGVMIIEIQEEEHDIQASPFDPTQVGRPCHESRVPSPEETNSAEGSDHVCDVKICPHNGCEQYRVTIAHTAALAVGWSVPGCAMGWGGECTCGEQCKCAGCPEHNPLS